MTVDVLCFETYILKVAFRVALKSIKVLELFAS